LAAVSSKASISAQPSLVKIDHIQPGIRGAIDQRIARRSALASTLISKSSFSLTGDWA
jgi:hypothetical protein